MSLWKKTEKPEPPAEKPEERETVHSAPHEGKPAGIGGARPQITQITPRAAIPGGEMVIRGSGLTDNGHRPRVHFGHQVGGILLSSAERLIVRVPEGASARQLTVETGGGSSVGAPVIVGEVIAQDLHPVASPAVDLEGNIFTTFSGTRGQKVPTSIFKIDSKRVVHPFLNDVMNATGLAFDHEGNLYVSSRMEGSIYKVTPTGQRTAYAQGMGVATGIAFDHNENLYVGDRTGTIFKIGRDRQIFVFATVEPSVAAYHLAFSASGDLYVTGPTTSSFDHVMRITPAGEVTSFFRGLGRPQGLAFDLEGNLYVAASLGGQRGVIRITPEGQAELVVSGYDLVGVAFGRHGSMILTSHSAVIHLALGIEGMPL